MESKEKQNTRQRKYFKKSDGKKFKINPTEWDGSGVSGPKRAG